MIEEIELKRCYRCREHKPVDAFQFRRVSEGIRQAHCRACKRVMDKERYSDPAQRELTRLRAREWARAHPELAAARRRQWAHGVSKADYDHRVDEQHGLCACCGKPPSMKRLAVDHDHLTGEIRGLLCDSCNLGIGQLGDNIEGVGRALDYLRRAAEL